jgi:hypothetical protein
VRVNLRRRLWFLPATFLGSVAIPYLFDRYGWRDVLAGAACVVLGVVVGLVALADRRPGR